MTKDVQVSLYGMQFEEDGEAIETTAAGTYYEKNGSSYLLYEEMPEGFEKPVKNRIKFGERFLELTRSGVVNVRMVFAENQKNLANYHTPYGVILVGTDTKKVEVVREPEQITITVDYALELNNEYLADCKILIVIRAIG